MYDVLANISEFESTTATTAPPKVATHVSDVQCVSQGLCLVSFSIVSRGDPLSFKMTQWSCYCIGESVSNWLEKGNSMDT